MYLLLLLIVLWFLDDTWVLWLIGGFGVLYLLIRLLGSLGLGPTHQVGSASTPTGSPHWHPYLPGNGYSFELHVQDCLRSMAYSVRATPKGGDFGVDLIATTHGLSVAIQTKNYKGNVGVTAVQEVHTGRAHYGAVEAWVVTTSDYTAQARQLAASTGVKLLTINQLHAMAAYRPQPQTDMATKGGNASYAPRKAKFRPASQYAYITRPSAREVAATAKTPQAALVDYCVAHFMDMSYTVIKLPKRQVKPLDLELISSTRTIIVTVCEGSSLVTAELIARVNSIRLSKYQGHEAWITCMDLPSESIRQEARANEVRLVTYNQIERRAQAARAKRYP